MTYTPKGEFYMDENRTYLKVWANGKHLELLQLAVQMFNEESTDFDVEISVEEKTGSVIKEELSTCLREGNYEDMPDIVLVDDAQMKFYLENYCEYFHCFEDLNTDDFNIFNNHNYFAENGWEKYAIPHSCNPFALYYNVDILEDCGIDVAELTDWESFREAGQQLKDNGYYLLPALDWYAITAFMYSAGIDLNFESEDKHESSTVFHFHFSHHRLFFAIDNDLIFFHIQKYGTFAQKHPCLLVYTIPIDLCVRIDGCKKCPHWQHHIAVFQIDFRIRRLQDIVPIKICRTNYPTIHMRLL